MRILRSLWPLVKSNRAGSNWIALCRGQPPTPEPVKSGCQLLSCFLEQLAASGMDGGSLSGAIDAYWQPNERNKKCTTAVSIVKRNEEKTENKWAGHFIMKFQWKNFYKCPFLLPKGRYVAPCFRSPGPVGNGRDSSSEGCEFKSQHQILNGHFYINLL